MAELIREKGSRELVANYGYADGAEVVNDFDSKYPWVGIEEFVDEHGDSWVRIPKFYRVINTEGGVVKGRELSEYKVDDDWKLNHAFVNNAGNAVNFIEVAKYQMSMPDGVVHSVAGQYPTFGISYADAKAAVAALNARDDGYEYFLSNIWVSEIFQDLMTVEFANSSSTAVMSGYPLKAGFKMTGETDAIPYCSGLNKVTDHANQTSCMKYRHMENIYGNGLELVDGVFLSNGSVTVDINGEEYTSSLVCPTNQSTVHQLGYDSRLDLVMPITIKSAGSYGDLFSGTNDKDRCVVYRGSGSTTGYGLFSYMVLDQTTKYPNGTYRVVRRLKD